MRITPANAVNGEVKLPGDKSISHRAAIFSAIATGRTVISNYLRAEDCRSTLQCLRQLGVKIEETATTVTVEGVGIRGLQAPLEPLDCGNSGTTMRLLAGVMAGQNFESILMGDSSLLLRPMQRVIGPLSDMGAKIEAIDERAPLHFSPAQRLSARSHELSIASAQVKSCILLAGLYADGTTSVIEPVKTRDHTERMLRWLGARVEEQAGRLSISGATELVSREISVPSDLSAAAFFMIAAAILPSSRLQLPGVGVNDSRAEIIEALREAGVSIDVRNERLVSNEPVADIHVSSITQESAEPLSIERDRVALLIDEIPILAVLGSQLSGGIEVRSAGELRHKESDRIAAIVANLQRMKADVEEFPDGFRVGRSRLVGAEVESFGDHRIAMAFAVAALVADGDTTIHGAECVDVSFPGFFETLLSVVR